MGRYVILRSVTAGSSKFAMPGMRALSSKSAKEVKLEVGDLTPRRAAEMSRKKGVAAVAPVVPMKLIAPFKDKVAASDATAEMTWGVGAVRADTSPFTGAGIVVAILDTGIDPQHEAFKGVKLVRKNFTDAGENDTDGHGTHCAGTVFGRDVKGLRIGVARGVSKALIGKVLGKGGGGSDQVAEAIQWAVGSGAQVISMSLGIDFPGYVEQLEGEGVPTALATSMALEGYRTNILLFERLAGFIAAQGAFGKPAVLVAAAGNESQRDINPEFEIAASPPAVAAGFVSVAAVGTTAGGYSVASFSNVGARISGPGVAIRSARKGGGLTSMSGTSMATPHVAGVAALWAEKLASAGQFTGQLLMDRLVGSATTVGMEPGFDPGDIGAGMVQAPQN